MITPGSRMLEVAPLALIPRLFRWSPVSPGPGWILRGHRRGFGWRMCLWEYLPDAGDR